MRPPDPHDIPTDPAQVWELADRRLQSSVPDSTYRLWLEPISVVGAHGETLYLRAPDTIRSWVERRYASLITDAVASAGGTLRSVSFAPPQGLVESPAGARGSLADTAPNPSYTFERFVIGEGNRFAHAAALAVAEAPSEAYNPLFLHGPPGLGKTHLLSAVANYLEANAPALNIRYATAETFTNEFVAALQASGIDAFKRRYRDLDVLLIDDIQFLEGKHNTEEEFFHTFNALYESGSQLVLSADRIPSQLSTLADRLRDRFEWGLTVPVDRPNMATRVTVLQRLVSEAGIELPDREVLNDLAGRIDANIRQLHGALTRVIAHASLMTRPISLDLLNEVLGPRGAPQASPKILVADLQNEVATRFGISRQELVGPSRAATPVRARQVAMFLTRELTDLSLPQIGRLYGGRDHSTVLNSLKRVEAESASDTEFAERVHSLRLAIHSTTPGQA